MSWGMAMKRRYPTGFVVTPQAGGEAPLVT